MSAFDKWIMRVLWGSVFVLVLIIPGMELPSRVLALTLLVAISLVVRRGKDLRLLLLDDNVRRVTELLLIVFLVYAGVGLISDGNPLGGFALMFAVGLVLDMLGLRNRIET